MLEKDLSEDVKSEFQKFKESTGDGRDAIGGKPTHNDGEITLDEWIKESKDYKRIPSAWDAIALTKCPYKMYALRAWLTLGSKIRSISSKKFDRKVEQKWMRGENQDILSYITETDFDFDNVLRVDFEESCPVQYVVIEKSVESEKSMTMVLRDFSAPVSGENFVVEWNFTQANKILNLIQESFNVPNSILFRADQKEKFEQVVNEHPF